MAANDEGIKVMDLLPIPDNLDILRRDEIIDNAATIRDTPTDSHALAMAEPDKKGVAQQDHELEVVNLGWNEAKDDIPNPLVGGMHNADLWVLIRRFNKQMYHVKEYSGPVPGNLDLNIADEEEFSPDKLRSNLERMYMTIGIGTLAAIKHITRLRSWRESRRTGAFCAAYTIAWYFDIIVPLFCAVAIALIAYPKSRTMLFPPAPIALVSAKTGGLQKPKAGVLGSTDSATGAPEHHKGEAVEAEASNFVNSIASVALSSASGKHPDATDADEADETRVPDPTGLAASAGDARATVSGKPKAHDKTKVPMETAIWNQMRPIMHGLADVTDTWERFGNALSPTPPFPKDKARLRLASLLVPLLAASFFITNYMVVKGITFGAGLGFFGDPVLTPAMHWLNTTFPHWQKLLELRNTLLKGVPTNAQLTLTCLRIGETNKAPLPPPPHLKHAPASAPTALSGSDLAAAGSDYPLNATDEEIASAMSHDPTTASATTGADISAAKTTKHGKGSRLLSVLKTGLKGSVSTALGADHLKAKTLGTEHARNRLGVVPAHPEAELSGPIEFKCRHHGRKGHAYVSVRATIPCVSFSADKSIEAAGTLGRDEEVLRPEWSVAVAEIAELKKVPGLNWKAKLVVGYALDREVADNLEIVDREGRRYMLTAMVLRDELFNRLVAMGGQKWESW